MSSGLRLAELKRSLAGKWQIPLLILAAGLLIGGVISLRPRAPALTFQEQTRLIRSLQRRYLYLDASRLIEQMLADPARTAAERAELHRLQAETIYLDQKRSLVRNPRNAERVILRYRAAASAGMALSSEAHRQMAEAWEWLGRPKQALEEYRTALAGSRGPATSVRRHIIELQLALPDFPPEELHAELDQLLQAAAGDLPSLLWAVEQKVELLTSEQRIGEAERLLEQVRDRLDDSSVRARFAYLTGLTEFRAGRLDDAERTLRGMRSWLRVRDELDAKSSLLLGRLNLQEDRPQEAMSFFDQVLAGQHSDELRASAILGRAQCLAALQRLDESAEAYAKCIAFVRKQPGARVPGREVVRASLTALGELLRGEGRFEQALRFLGLAAALILPDDEDACRFYAEQFAELHRTLGERGWRQLEQAEHLDDVQREKMLSEVRGHFIAAGEHYQRLSELWTLDEDRSARVMWQAAGLFDRSGDRDRAISALERFVRDHPHSPRVPQALFRLGQAYQAAGLFDKAIARYRQNLQQFPRSPGAFQSVVPLADCYLSIGVDNLELAEKALLLIVAETPGRPSVFTPEAPEYADALFKLGQVYLLGQQYEQAAFRLDEMMRRYPQDSRAVRVKFLLGDAYFQSGLALAENARKVASAARRDEMVAESSERLLVAHDLFGQVIAAYEGRQSSDLASLDVTYLRLSYSRRADCMFDLGRYEEAAELYEQAAWKYRAQGAALSAYVQIINCYQRLGRSQEARAALERARWLADTMPERALDQPAGEDAKQWRSFLDWVAGTGVF